VDDERLASLAPDVSDVPAERVAPARAEPTAGNDVQVGIRDDVRDERHGNAGPFRVMVVDDNRDAADSMAVFLELAGFETAVQLDGPSALDAAAAQLPHVVLLDIGLPGLDGYEVARRFRTLPGGADCLLIALTGYGQQDDRRRAHEAGFDVHLVKPADPDAVVELIQEWRQRDGVVRSSEAATR
jgi:CheY-like chemotaxis protein